MSSGAWNEIKLCADFAGFILVKCSLNAEMLCAGSARSYPLEQPVVTLVSACHFQGYEEMAAEKYHAILGTFSQDS